LPTQQIQILGVMVVHGSNPEGSSNPKFIILNFNVMKNKTIIAILLFSLLTATCKKETNPASIPQTGSKITFTGQDQAAGLKSTTLSGFNVSWSASDQVGLYCAQAAGTNTNAAYTAATSGAISSFSGTMTWGTGPHTFYAYYPYAGTSGSPAATVVPVSLLTAQTQSGANSSAHIGALDFTVATATASPGTSGDPVNVDLHFNHVFTLLEFQIKGSGTLAKVSLSGSNTLAFSGGTIDITQTPVTDVAYTIVSKTGTTTQAVVTLTTPATLDATNATTVYMVINPGTQTGNCVIGLSTDGTTCKYNTNTALSGGFLRGKKYVVSVDANDATALSIGDSYHGGKIFYFLQPGDPGYVSGEIHGLIAATADQSTGIIWAVTAYQSTWVPSGTSATLGSGAANTVNIIAQNGAGTTDAAGLAGAYSGGGYNDWYLPSKDELNLLYSQKSAVGGFANTYYWSSTEFDKYTAWVQYFGDGTWYYSTKGHIFSVRPIRAF
jgi:hypothetical protein